MIAIPEAIWVEMLEQFAQQPHGVERVAFFDGYRQEDMAVVTTLTIPNAECHPGFYTTSAAAMSEAGSHLRRYQMQRLMQVHTHGNVDLRHSLRDDQMAYSQAPGALSLVLPYHAVHRPTPFEGLLHIRDSFGWQTVGAKETQLMILIVPTILDLRRMKPWTQSQAVTPETWMGAFGRYLIQILLPWRSR